MTIRNVFLSWLLVTFLAASMSMTARAQEQGPPLPPLRYPILKQLRDNPEAWQRFRAEHRALPAAPTAAPGAAPALLPGWTRLNRLLPSGFSASNPLLLTDGTVLVHVSCTPYWYRLKPDINGNYVNGTWSLIAPLPQGYAPRFFASAVLPQGWVIAEGGEYNGGNCNDVETPLGAIYDPVGNYWISMAPPAGWTQVGDASGIVLANGIFVLSNCCNTQAAWLNATTLTWNPTGFGKFDDNNEENWTLLPNGDVLTVDGFVGLSTCVPRSELYSPTTGDWSYAGSTVYQLADCRGSIKSFEAPTQILRPNGLAVAFGATTSLPTQNTVVHTGIYHTDKAAWSGGPNMPKVGTINYTMADAPAAILPNGNVLIAASPSTWQNSSSYPAPTHFFVFNGTTFTQVGDVADSSALSSYEVNFLVLPTGQILAVETDFPNIQVFPAVANTLTCCAQSAWAPVIFSVSHTLVAGQNYTVKGSQFGGRTQGAAYGDNVQGNTNYPLVRIVNNATHHVFYARTYDFTSVSVAPNIVSKTNFTVPTNIETGPSALYVVTNGIPSQPVAVTLTK